VEGREALVTTAKTLESVPSNDPLKGVCAAVSDWILVVIRRLPPDPTVRAPESVGVPPADGP
jgi:hypothetical protein